MLTDLGWWMLWADLMMILFWGAYGVWGLKIHPVRLGSLPLVFMM